MIARYKSLFLLLFVFFGSAQLSSAQSFEFLLQVPVIDSANGNQWAVGQTFWLEPDPSYTGSIYHYSFNNGAVNSNGALEDSIFVLGPGMGALLLHTIDCHGDTITTTVPFDSTLSWTTHIADTIFICAGSNAACTASFTATNTSGLTYDFVGTTTGVGVVTQLQWSFGDGNYSSAPNPTHTYGGSGTVPVYYNVDYSTGCHASSFQVLTVGGGALVCNTLILPSQIGNATNFYVNYSSSGTLQSLDWDFGDGQTLSTTTNGSFHNYASNGTYNVCVITSFSDGCHDTTCQNINIVLGGQGACAAWFSYGVNGQTVSFQDSTVATAPVQSWWWNFGDGSVDSTSGANVSHTYAGQGPFNVQLEIFTTDTCYSDTTRSVSLLPSANCSAGFTHAPDTSGQYTILAFNTSTGNNLSYQWSFGDGGTSTLQYPVHQFAGAGTYNICLVVIQPNPACTDTFCDSVTITQKQALAFTFGVVNPATGITNGQVGSGGLQIAPHPVRDRLHITLPTQQDGLTRLCIYNAFGQSVTEQHIVLDSGSANLDVTDLPNGMYVVRLGTETARFWVLK
jgi:PKD repeat protein